MKESLTSGGTWWKMNVSSSSTYWFIFVNYMSGSPCERTLYVGLSNKITIFNGVSAGDPGVVQGSCPNRKESKPLTSKSASLFLQNYFPTMPVQAEACKEHSTQMINLVGTCYKAAGNVMPNFLAVNFYMVFGLLIINKRNGWWFFLSFFWLHPS